MFNEETVGTIVQLSRRHADEVVCIDDGSSDHSARIAEAAGATVIRHRTNLGYGAALKSLNKARADDVDVLIILDSDGQHDLNDVPSIIIRPILADEADLVIGSRFHRRRWGFRGDASVSSTGEQDHLDGIQHDSITT